MRSEINVFSRVYELLKVLDQARTVYMKRLRTVTLHAEYESESVLLNLLLRNYLHYNLYEQAEKLISKSTFPEQGNALIFHSKLIIFHLANNNEYARYFYYLGRIKAIQLEYSNAQKMLTNGKNTISFHYLFDSSSSKVATSIRRRLPTSSDKASYSS